MNKMIKGSVAGATGIALLMGGFGTYAMWSQDATMGASQVKSGHMTIQAGDVHWNDLRVAGADDWDAANALVVPGDSVSRTQTFNLTGTGKHLKGTVNIAAGAKSSDNAADWYDIAVQVTSGDTTKIVPVANTNNFTFDAPFNTASVTAVVTYTIKDVTGTTAQDATAGIADSTITIAQTN